MHPYESSLPALPDPSFINHGIQAFGEYRILSAAEQAELTITPIFLRESQPAVRLQAVAAGQAPIVTSLPIDDDPSRQSTVSHTPGTPAPLPLAAGTADVSSRHGDAGSDQATSRSLLLPEPAQAAIPPAAGSVASATTAQASGRRRTVP